jgi:NADH:ubiquinone oxidoreductase subunit C
MYGIDFEGNDRLGEFILEDWDDMPPMRRDFDTVKYAGEHYYKRPGREDAQDVRETISKHSGEEIPDFAKDYSIRQREE